MNPDRITLLAPGEPYTPCIRWQLTRPATLRRDRVTFTDLDVNYRVTLRNGVLIYRKLPQRKPQVRGSS